MKNLRDYIDDYNIKKGLQERIDDLIDELDIDSLVTLIDLIEKELKK